MWEDLDPAFASFIRLVHDIMGYKMNYWGIFEPGQA